MSNGVREHGINASPPVRRQPYGVLVVDPDPDTRYLYKIALEPLGVAVAEAEDGAEGLGRAICDPPAVIVTETTMPRLDGFALCTSLRRNPITADVHIVVASASPNAWSRAFVSGADRVLIKPYPIDELINTVREILLKTKTLPH